MRAIAGALAALLLAGCAAPTTPPSPATTPSSRHTTPPAAKASPSPTPHTTPTARPATTAVITAGGVSQWIHCAGSGSPTILVIPGLHSTYADWRAITPALERRARTCVYERPGLGRSPAADRTDVDAGLHARELSALLTSAGEPGPFLVVGHSYGGLVARAFAEQNPGKTDALLLAEGVAPGDPNITGTWQEGGTDVDLARSLAASQGLTLGSTPLVVMTASAPDRNRLDGPTYGQSDEVTAQWLAAQRASTALSTDSIQVTARSGHELQKDAPATVLAAIDALLADVRDRIPLACDARWSALHAACRTG